MSQKKSSMRVVRNRKFMIFKRMPPKKETEIYLWIVENRKFFGAYFSALAKTKVLKRVYYEAGIYHFVGINSNLFENDMFDEMDITELSQPYPYRVMVSILFELEIDLMPPRIEGYEGTRYTVDNDVAKWIGDKITDNSKVKVYLFDLAVFNGYIIKNEDGTWQGINYDKKLL